MTHLLAFILLATNADQIAASRSALEDGLPGVAISKLERVPPGQLDAESALLLARAYVEDGRPAGAIEILKAKVPGREFWLAQAFAALGQRDEALDWYRSAKMDPAHSVESCLGEAGMLRSLGRPDEAILALKKLADWRSPGFRLLAQFIEAESLLDLGRAGQARAVLDAASPADKSGSAMRDFLLARALVLSGDDAGAIRLFDSLSPVDAHMAVSAIIGQAEAMERTGQASAAEALIEGFLSKNSDAAGIENLFALLDRSYAGQAAPASTELKRWANDESPSPRRLLAAYYLARFESRLGREDRAERLLERATGGEGSSPAGGEGSSPAGSMAALDLARIRLKQGRGAEALALLQLLPASPDASFLRGLALASMGQREEASKAFLSASSSQPLAESALFNAAVCELGSLKKPAFELLKARFPQSAKLDLLRLQSALVLASARDPQAENHLRGLAANEGSPIAGAAALALAEWKFERHDVRGAIGELQRVSTLAGADPARAAALAVFLADDGGIGDEAVKAAEKFLAMHPGTQPEPEIRMKLGEILYRRGDFAGARIQLESLAAKFPGSAQEIPALFLAAQAASRLQSPASANDAMALYEEVAASGSPLALRARLEQAILKTIQGKASEGVAILDRILALNPDPEMRAAALMEKGKALLGAPEPGAGRAAVEIWKALAADRTLSAAWRNQALVRIGAAYEKSGDTESAVATYYDVLKAGQTGLPEYFWFYKAGFSAARLLEASKRWDQAIRIYELIAAVNGPRQEDAASRINKIRLENFLWEAKPQP
ncbi:MAG: tetratricopeptide repeat protein [Verrucomicrobiae bacterium]